MSLTGNLEDLPLLDILQIVSFSKKTGYLSIKTNESDGAIVFRDGFVICSFVGSTPAIDPGVAKLPLEQREAAIRKRIEIALEQLIRLREGQFNFSLTEEPPKVVEARAIAAETLVTGINPQELLLDLARGIDEDRRNSSAAIEASFAEPEGDTFEEDLAAAPEAAGMDLEDLATTETAPFSPDVTVRVPVPIEAPPAPELATVADEQAIPPETAVPPVKTLITTILLADDEEDVRRVLSARLADAGYEIVEAEDTESAIKKANRLGKANIDFILITDLGMPTSGGTSFQGGFEIIKRLWKMHLHPPVLMMTETLSTALQARARQMGISGFIFKPGLSKLDAEQFEADLRAFATRMIADFLPKLSRKEQPIRRVVTHAKAEAVTLPRAPQEDEMSQQFSLLQRQLDDLRQRGDANQIAHVIMKTAREFFERSILFLVKNEEVRGLGGFGRAPKDFNLSLMVREIAIPIGEPSIFRDVAVSRRHHSGPIPEGKWTQYLMGKIGRFRSSCVALFPLVTHRETIAILYGDNADSGREFGRMDALEVFVNQAGVAMENVFLQRKIEALHNRG